jgi:hypothetical protein
MTCMLQHVVHNPQVRTVVPQGLEVRAQLHCDAGTNSEASAVGFTCVRAWLIDLQLFKQPVAAKDCTGDKQAA